MSHDVLLTDSHAVAASVPDRADAPVSEVTERFLRAVIAEIPVERIEELHLFSALRQGPLETGIAVIALRASVPVAQAAGDDDANAAPELPFADADADADAAVDAGTAAAGAMALTEDTLTEFVADDITVVDAIVEAVLEGAPGEDIVSEDVVVEDTVVEDLVVEEAVAEVIADDSPDADEEAIVLAVEVAPRPPRHTVYTARYRYIIKGPERGKWEASVKVEADAPLITVETVVRGVQRRAGEESEIVRYTGDQIARALRITFPVA